jgi:uncharacterized protein (TIGR03790 family)
MIRNALAPLVVVLAAVPAVAGGGPAETVVLVNTASAESRKVADYYVGKRDIPAQQVCEVTCGTGLDTSMDDFVKDVVDPLRTFLHARGLEDRCRFLVLTQGMPIRAHTPTGDVSTAAALSLLDTEICGQPQTRGPVFKHDYTAGAVGTQPRRVEGKLYLVTALLSSTAEEAMALVDRSVASDGTAPAGARIVFQDASGAAAVRDRYYDDERRALEALGFATEHDRAGADAVKGRDRVIGYMNGGAYSALSVDGVGSNKYLPGAICDMLQSFGAVPENFTPGGKGSQFPVTHMVRAGITGVHGAVQEPYNVAFPDWQLFRPYVLGFTLAETFHQRMPYVYWMNLTLGDPLCAPYAKRIVPSVETESGADGNVAFKLSAPGAVRIDVYVDGRAAGSVTGDSGTVSVSAADWPQAPRHRVLVETTGTGDAEPRGWIAKDVAWKDTKPRAVGAPARVRCDKLVVEAPAAVRAGEQFTVRALAANADGRPTDGWRGRLELRSAVPPVRWVRADSPTPGLEMPCRMTRAGDFQLRVTAPDDGREATVKVRVDAGPLHHATCPASDFPLGQEADLEVVLEDEFMNRVKDYSGTISLSVPDDAGATIPPPIVLTPRDGGRGVFRGVVLTHPGETALVLKDAGGAVVSERGEHVNVLRRPIRTWLVAGPGPAREWFASDPTAAAKGEGALVAKQPLRRCADADAVALPPCNEKGGEAAALVTWIDAGSATKARLLAAAAGRLRVWLDGKEIFDGVPKTTDPRGARDPVAELTLAAGVHRLAVVAEAKGQTAASFEIDDGKGGFPAALRLRAHAADAAKK